MRRYTFVLMAILIPTTTVRAHDDVVPYANGGKVVTGGHDDVLGTDHIEQHVFGYDFGEDPLDPFIIGDPGFNNGSSFAVGVYPGDGLLPANFTLGLNVVTDLQYWDGVGGVSLVPAPTGVELGVRRGSSTVFVTGSGQSGVVPTIGSTGAVGRLHVHVESLLAYTDGTSPAVPNAPDGIYLVGLRLTLPGSGLADSDPIYLLYNNNLDEDLHDAAIDWTENTLVPEPATGVLMLAGCVALVAIGRRRFVRAAPPRDGSAGVNV